MSGSSYRILDEPIAGGLKLPALSPFWPLLGMMFGGAWLGVSMFVFNAIALRGPTMAREIGLAAAILIGSPLILLLIGFALQQQWINEAAIRYAVLVIVAWKFSLAYWIYFSQQGAHALYEYFDRSAANPQMGAGLVFVGSLLKSKIIGVSSSPFWILMVN